VKIYSLFIVRLYDNRSVEIKKLESEK